MESTLDRYLILATKILGTINAGLGLSILVSSEERFQSATFKPVMGLLDGQMWPFGLFYLISGLLMLIGSRAGRIVGLSLGVLTNQIFAALFLASVIQYHNSAPTAFIAYGGYGVINGLLAALLERNALHGVLSRAKATLLRPRKKRRT